MVKEFTDAVDARKVASMQSPQDAGSVGIPYEANQTEMQYPQLPMNGVDSDVADPLNGNQINPLGAPGNLMYMAGMPSASGKSEQLPFESDNQPKALGSNFYSGVDHFGGQPMRSGDSFYSGVDHFGGKRDKMKPGDPFYSGVDHFGGNTGYSFNSGAGSF